MKRVKLSMLTFAMMFSTVQIKTSSAETLFSQLLSNPNVMPVVVAVTAGIAKQMHDVYNGQNKTFNPLVLEAKAATVEYGPSIAAGLQAAGASVHVKVPTELSLDSVQAEFAPFISLDCAPGSDKALLNRTEGDKQPVLSLRAGLSQNCKIEARCNVSNAIWAGMAIGGVVATQLAVAYAQSGK